MPLFASLTVNKIISMSGFYPFLTGLGLLLGRSLLLGVGSQLSCGLHATWGSLTA